MLHMYVIPTESEPLELELWRAVSHHVGVRAGLLEEQPVLLT